MKSFFACLLISLLVTSWTNADDEATTEGPPPTFGPGPHCTGAQHVAFFKCLDDILQANFADLDKRGQKNIDDKVKLIQGCYTKSACTAKIDFTKAPEDQFDDPDVKNLIKGFVKFLEGTRREFLKCIMTDLRDKLILGLEDCIKRDAQFFAFPKPYPELPFPSEQQFTDKAKRALLKKELSTLFNGFYGLQECTDKEKIPDIVKCILKPLNDPVTKCAKTKMCAFPGCKSDFPGVCHVAGKCLKEKLGDAASFFKADNQNKVLDLMGFCEKQAQKIYKITTPLYVRGDVVKLYTLAKKVADDAEKREKFISFFGLFATKLDAGRVFCQAPCL